MRDLKSLNGTRINGDALDSEWELSPGDEFQIGKARFIFVEQIEELPPVPHAVDQGHRSRSRNGCRRRAS